MELLNHTAMCTSFAFLKAELLLISFSFTLAALEPQSVQSALTPVLLEQDQLIYVPKLDGI